jgi:hypothetical protein
MHPDRYYFNQIHNYILVKNQHLYPTMCTLPPAMCEFLPLALPESADYGDPHIILYLIDNEK